MPDAVQPFLNSAAAQELFAQGVNRLVHIREIDKRHRTVLCRAGSDVLVET